jgi:hypothetical protein
MLFESAANAISVMEMGGEPAATPHSASPLYGDHVVVPVIGFVEVNSAWFHGRT